MTTEDRQLLAKATKLLEALVEPHEAPEGDDHKWRECRRCLAREELEYDSSVPMFVALLAALRRLEAVERQTCESCEFAGKPLRYCDELTLTHRYCVQPAWKNENDGDGATVPLTVNGHPFGCAGWQAKAPQETR